MNEQLSRRDMLKWMSAGAGAAAVSGGFVLASRPSKPGDGASPDRENLRPDKTADTAVDSTDGSAVPATDPSPAPVATGDQSSRVLVVVEMNGGNDGLSMFVPHGMGAYYDLRQRTGIPADEVLDLDGELGMHPRLAALHGRGLAVVEGVGSFNPDGSHFAMSERWWAGDAQGTSAYDTGIWGRLADVIGDGSAPAVAMSIGAGTHRSMVSRKAGTLSLYGPDSAGYLAGANEDDPMRRAFQQAIAAYGAGPVENVLGRARYNQGLASGFAQRLVEMSNGDEDGDGALDTGVEYSGSELSNSMRFTARLLGSGQGVRIVHVTVGGFDTHENHVNEYPELMGDLDSSIDAFLRDIDAMGMSDRVLLMTTSEFGRRAADNGSAGLDHGAASSMALFGPVNRGRFGQHPSLTDLVDDNLVATVGFDQYYATVAEGWFGVPPSELFNDSVETIGGIFN
jgi:uncharacterized protein (DUF1501 family)